jgi:hypothetical protein
MLTFYRAKRDGKIIRGLADNIQNPEFAEHYEPVTMLSEIELNELKSKLHNAGMIISNVQCWLDCNLKKNPDSVSKIQLLYLQEILNGERNN